MKFMKNGRVGVRACMYACVRVCVIWQSAKYEDYAEFVLISP